MAWSLDTDSFLAAFARMTSRRGVPLKVINSDNGKNFVGGNNERKELLALLDQEKIKNNMANKGIEWKFNPPGASHFGGFYETLIKSLKRAMNAVLGNADITDEELLTAIIGAEGLLNSRPLTYQSNGSKDEPGQCGGKLAPETADDLEIHPRRRWFRIHQLIKGFWKRWIRELLPMLNTRAKWTVKSRDLAVCWRHGNLFWPKFTSWKVATRPDIEKVYQGPDGHVCVAKMRVGKNFYTRPITKLYLLKLDSRFWAKKKNSITKNCGALSTDHSHGFCRLNYFKWTLTLIDSLIESWSLVGGGMFRSTLCSIIYTCECACI